MRVTKSRAPMPIMSVASVVTESSSAIDLLTDGSFDHETTSLWALSESGPTQFHHQEMAKSMKQRKL